MTLRTDILSAMKTAMKEKEALTLSTLRLINAAVKDRDIAARLEDRPDGIGDEEILSLLAKMVKQREDSARIYDENGRPELAERERAEMEVIRTFLPKALSEDETKAAVKAAIETLSATCLKDMGRVMGALKSEYAGRMDMAMAGKEVKALLGA